MLGAREFALMRDGAWFINTARAQLIDSDALLAQLRTGRINALLDVTEPYEPLPADSPFWALPNCVILPHMAAVTREARLRQRDIMVAEIQRFVQGEALQHQVNRAHWETMA
jgi:phosphoglycerate dehydrogenase-like enzyme